MSPLALTSHVLSSALGFRVSCREQCERSGQERKQGPGARPGWIYWDHVLGLGVLDLYEPASTVREAHVYEWATPLREPLFIARPGGP